MTENYVFTEGNKRKLIDTVDKKDLEKGNLEKYEQKMTAQDKPVESVSNKSERVHLKIDRNAYTEPDQNAAQYQKLLDSYKIQPEEPRYSESKSGKVSTLRISLSPKADTKLLKPACKDNEIELKKEEVVVNKEEAIKPEDEKTEEKTIPTTTIKPEPVKSVLKESEKTAFLYPFPAKSTEVSPLNNIPNSTSSSLFPAIPNPNNPFLNKSGFTFNINFNFANVSKVNNDDIDSEGENESDALNPEEEVEIKPTSKVSLQEVTKTNPNIHYKKDLETFFVYDFEAKKFLNKGKGTLSFEFAEGNKKLGFCVFRSAVGVIIFQGRIIPNTSTIDTKFHNYKHIVMLQKLASKVGDKVQTAAVRIELANENVCEEFRKKFEEFTDLLK
jgi:hypothetical protein